MPELDRRKNDVLIHERLAVLETITKTQSKSIEEILCEVKTTGAFVSTYTEKVDRLDKAGLNTRLTKVETQQRIYIGIGAGLISLTGLFAMLKEKIASFF